MLSYSSLGLHIALSKYPLGDEVDYMKGINRLYQAYKDGVKENIELSGKYNKEEDEKLFDGLFQPITYHLFGHFDLATISIIDSLKFTQRIYEPNTRVEHENRVNSVSYQIISGAIYGNETNIKSSVNCKKQFISIVQLKLNNNLLIGNGNAFSLQVITSIKALLTQTKDEVEYVLIDSYNWAEICLVLFADKTQILADTILRVRTLTVANLENDNIVKTSLFENYAKNIELKDAHLFCDTQSYFGVERESFINKGVKLLENLESEVELQIKPGHFPYLANESTSLAEGVNELSDIRYKNGQTDFVFSGKLKSIEANQNLFHELRKSNVRRHVRKVITKPHFHLSKEIIDEYRTLLVQDRFQGPIGTETYISKFRIFNLPKIIDDLRVLNLSRNVRKKIRKIIYNYNLGIQDPILFVYFVDLQNFLKYFIRLFSTQADIISNIIKGNKEGILMILPEANTLKTKYIEEIADQFIYVFEEALDDRILNNYNFEDINEFNLDANSSSTSLLSALDSIIKFTATCLQRPDGECIVTRMNDNETISSRLSINYNIHHLMNPSFVFATLIKEILNVSAPHSEENHDKLYRKLSKKIRKTLGDEYFIDLWSRMEMSYFEVDFKKFYLTFFENKDLYIFWHWSYAFQSSHLYSSTGSFDETMFVKELFRLMMLVGSVEGDKGLELLKCPHPMVRSYWDRYYFRLRDLVSDILLMEEFINYRDANLLSVMQVIYANGKNEKINTGRTIESRFLRRTFLTFIENSEVLAMKMKSDYATNDFRIDNYRALYSDYENLMIVLSLSYFNLLYIFEKFNSGQIVMLKRDFSNGRIQKNYLTRGSFWFLDSFGGYFINSIKERRDYMEFNCRMISVVISLGNILKLNLFKV